MSPHDHSSHAGHSHSGHSQPGHSHAVHGHSHAPSSFGTAFAVAIALNVGIVVAEVVGGLASGSMSLLSDAAHNLSDVLGLAAAFAAHRLGRRPPSARFTYGLGGTSILAALGNAVVLLIVCGALGLEAIQRFVQPEPVVGGTMMAVAAAAILVNGLSALMLAPGRDGDLNLRAAVAHLAADAAVAAGVVVAGLMVTLTGWRWLDPAVSLAINGLIVAGTWSILREALAMSLAGVPAGIDLGRLRAYLAALPGVEALHDLHVWSTSTSERALTVHLVMPAGHPGDAFLMTCCKALHEEHGIGHATLQVEIDALTECALAPDHVV